MTDIPPPPAASMPTPPPPAPGPTPPPPAPAQKKSIWKNKWLWIGIGAVLVIGAIGNALGGGKTEPARTAAPSSSAAPAEAIIIPDVAGKPGSEAEKLLVEAGFLVERDGAGEVVVKADNWDAKGTTPAAGEKSEKGGKVTLHMVRATERLAAEAAALKAANEKSAADAAAKPLEAVQAQVFCEDYAKREFPYGVKLHTFAGKLAEQKTEAGWYLKFEASITNEFGAKRDSNVECHMSGTNGTPVMDDFVAY